MSRLDEIEARANAATRGPWEWYADALFSQTGHEPDWDPKWDDPGEFARIIETDGGEYPPRDNDRAFIAHAREDIPWLLAEVGRLQKELDERTYY